MLTLCRRTTLTISALLITYNKQLTLT